MRQRILFALAAFGVILGLFAAYLGSRTKPAEPPVFSPAQNPFAAGIYANGIIESYQPTGENINVFPVVTGTVTTVPVEEGQSVQKGDILMTLDDSVQRATAAQLKSQAEAARAVLESLKAQPRKEVLDVAKAQVDAAVANLKNVQDQLAKIRRSYRIDHRSVSRDTLDNAVNSVRISQANLSVARKQYALTKAGAWSFDIQNQEKQYKALLESAQSADALLAKYTIRAPVDGTILQIKAAIGSFVSSQGIYGTYTQGLDPILVMGQSSDFLAVRCFVDEILVNRLPPRMTAQMSVRGASTTLTLEFVRTVPYVTPKIQLSNQRLERVDVRVLPVVFRFKRPENANLFPGQLVDVFIGEGPPATSRIPASPSKRGGK